jgi:cytidylate kinase
MPQLGPMFAAAPPRVLPFITIAQQIGAEVPNLPQRLAEVLDSQIPGGPEWSHWDRELIQKVWEDSRIPAELIESLETSGHSWLDDLLNGIAGRVDEMAIFHRIKDAVRAVAESGHAILIGHGSVYFTRDMPGGLHVRLIAPMPVRVAHVAERFGLTPEKAARHIRQMDRRRQGFFSRFGVRNRLDADMFSAVLNTRELDEHRIIQAIAAMVPAQGDSAAFPAGS